MYSGKTTIGKQLARQLGYEWCDTDKLFEEKFKTTIAEFFTKFGETAFREKEKDILIETFSKKNLVVSTGGGLPCYENNMELIKSNGLSVYLQASIGTIMNRQQHSKVSRPLFKNLSRDEIKIKIEQHLDIRKPIYEQANITISAENFNISVLINAIINSK